MLKTVPWQGFLVLISKHNICSVMLFFICVIGAVMTSSREMDLREKE